MSKSWYAGLPQALLSLSQRIKERALSLADTTEDLPWGHPALKVRGKTFLFMGADGATLNLSMKLPDSGPFALDLPNAAPTGYGLGRSGWVTLRIADPDDADEERLFRWLEESYAAVAPKRKATKASRAQTR